MEDQNDNGLPHRSLEVSDTLLHGGLDSSLQVTSKISIRIHNAAWHVTAKNRRFYSVAHGAKSYISKEKCLVYLTECPGLEIIGEFHIKILGNVLKAGLGQGHAPCSRVGQAGGIHARMLKLNRKKDRKKLAKWYLLSKDKFQGATPAKK